MNYGIILIKSLIDKDKKIKQIAKNLNLTRVNNYSKLNIQKFSGEMKYRLANYTIWGIVSDEYQNIEKIGLHPVKGGHEKIKNKGFLENFNTIFENMYKQIKKNE